MYARGYRNILLAAVAIVFGYSCIDEYFPEVGQKYEQILVVDGMITNQPPPYTVKLSYSTRLERPEFTPAMGFEVQIADDLGNIEYLVEYEPGIYQSATTGMVGTAGRKYRLLLHSPQGESYTSAFELLEQPVEIDSVYAEVEYQEDPEYLHDLEGLRFYVDTKETPADSSYFLWKLDGTYQYTANYYIKYVFDGQMKPFTQYDSLYTCWHTYRVPEIFTVQTANLSEPYVRRFPLHFVNTQDRKLSIRYSLLTRQIRITREAHTYWNELKKQNDNAGSLFPTQPFQIQGNITNIAETDELVLGYFMAGGESQKRTFTNRPTSLQFYYLIDCALITEDIYTILFLWRDQWPLYLPAAYSETGQGPVVPVSQTCTNCTASGGTIIKPEFWIDINYDNTDNTY